MPRLSVIMPCRNEARHIAASVGSVLAFDYPPDRLTLTVVDGMSDDGTRDILAQLAGQDDRVRVLDNPDRLPAPGLNVALEDTGGDVVMRVDAHSMYRTDYARACVTALTETDAANVGGVLRTIPGADTPQGRANATVMGHTFGVGNAQFRTGSTRRTWVDTVPFGCWRLETLKDLGGFATDIPYGEDDELNGRLRKSGGRILLDPAIRADYVARGTLGALLQMMFRYGRSKPATVRRLGQVPTLRQLVPPAFVLTLLFATLGTALWPPIGFLALIALVAHLSVGTAIAIKARSRLGNGGALRLPFTFLLAHLTYGLGYLAGVLRIG